VDETLQMIHQLAGYGLARSAWIRTLQAIHALPDGAIIYYDPEQGRPTYLSDYEKRIDLARQIVRRACNDL
jgi:hypothetical protein